MTKKLIILIVFCVNYYTNAFCYDDRITHPSITEKAINNSGLGLYIKNSLGLNDGIDTKILSNSNDTVKVFLKTGSTEEDSPSCRAASHFLNPLKPWNEAGLSDTNETLFGFGLNTYCFGSAPFSSRFSIHKYSDVTWATRYTSPTEQGGETGNDMDWTAARTYYRLALTATDQYSREGYFAKTFQALGQVMHLLQDMAVPAHVRNDFTAHLVYQKAGLSSPTTWFANSYEWYVKNHPELFKSGMADIEVVTPPNSLLTAFWDANNDQGLAEYTNANFFSESTIFAELKDSADIHYFPRPARADTNAAAIETQAVTMEVTAEDGELDKPIYITKNNSSYKMATYSFVKKWVDNQILADGFTPYEIAGYITGWEYNLDDAVYMDYAQELLPRAVGYSAALINYFFRGHLETSALEKLDENGNVTELLVNVKNTTTDETMKDGFFTLAYRYIPTGWGGQYVYSTRGNIPSGEFSFDSSKQLSFVLTEPSLSDPSQMTGSPIPADATGKEYTLVFHGTLGAETGAVVGKVVEVIPAEIAITAPEHFVYALADDGLPNKSFAKLRMQLRDNAPTIVMTGGSVIATAKYKVHLSHTDDLANEPPDGGDRAYDFTTLAALPVAIALDETSAQEVEFDFSANPIPFGITDLSLEVVYRKDDAVIAVGTKDLNEPQYVGVWNSHDRFLIDFPDSDDTVHNWQPMTQDEIMDDPGLVWWLDTDRGGMIDEIIDPVDVDIDVAFVGDPQEVSPENYHASFSHIPAGRFGRLAFIADQSPVFALFRDRYTSSLPDTSAGDDYLTFDGISRYFFPGVTNQQVEGTYYYSPIYLFRGIKNHFSYISVGIFPKPANRTEEAMAIKEANWPAPVSTVPVPATTIKP